MGIKLHPAQYWCPVHASVELTEQIAELLDDRVDVAYLRRPVRLHFPRSDEAPARAKPFKVIVHCPGSPGTKDSQHKQTCEGKYWT